jgi:ArsR family transcriptional regulator, arsenate/arsenite/antimonite-responsive transcriptional repressor
MSGRLYFYISGNIIDNPPTIQHSALMKIDDVAARLEALGNPTRLKIFRALVRAGDGGLSVGKLQLKLDIAPSTLSHHLKSMLIVGLIAQERQSTTLICRANYTVMRSLVDFMVAECCIDTSCSHAITKIDAA